MSGSAKAPPGPQLASAVALPQQPDELADAYLAGMLPQHVDELQSDRVAERLGHLGHAERVLAFDVGVDDGLAARLTGGSLLLRRQLQIDGHLYTYID